MTMSQDIFCSECGYKNCPHQGNQLTEIIMPSEDLGYNTYMDNSLDNKTPVLIGQSIHFALMKYFGSGEDSKSLLCYEWLKVRGPLEPLVDLGNYLMYRKNYNFEELN